ncbi:hypothetical protein BpHYR1_011895, partial [Brachionus plicatilis]
STKSDNPLYIYVVFYIKIYPNRPPSYGLGITNVQPSLYLQHVEGLKTSSIFECINQNITLCPSKSNNSFEIDIQILIKHYNELKEHFFISDGISNSIKMCLENMRFKDYRLDEFHNLSLFINFNNT